MRRLGLFVLLLWVAFTVPLLSSCGGVTEGTVIEKKHEPMHVWTVNVPDYVTVTEPRTTCGPTSGGKTTCATTYRTVRKPVGSRTETKVDDEDFYLVLRDEDGNTGQVDVDEATYDRTELGQWYP